jgi:hypothetical protein
MPVKNHLWSEGSFRLEDPVSPPPGSIKGSLEEVKDGR